MKKTLFLAMLLAPLFFTGAWAVPATPNPIIVTQPDGRTLTIRLHGDEFFHYATTEDGYLLLQNASGAYEYAVLDAAGQPTTTGIVAHNARTTTELQIVRTLRPNVYTPAMLRQLKAQGKARMMRNVPKGGLQKTAPRGAQHCLVILMNFTDKKFTKTRQNFHDMLNQHGYSANGGTGSANDYFVAASDSIYQPVFDVYGPYEADFNMAHYGAESGTNNDTDVPALIKEACQKADADGVNFANYDFDNNGTVDLVFVVFAGNNQAEGGGPSTIWPHRFGLYGSNTIILDGKTVVDYACTSEMRGRGSTMCGIGTFCHEFSHLMGLPDFYDTDYNHETLGSWDIMCTGSYNNNGCTPPTFSAIERFYSGYMNEPDLVRLDTAGIYTLEPIETSNKAYLLSSRADGFHNMSCVNPSPNEFFMLENRQRVGWDAPFGALPNTGLLITRVKLPWGHNPNGDINAMGCDIMEAAGGNGSAQATYPQGNINSFIPTLIDGTQLADNSVTYIEDIGGTMMFRYKGGGENFPNVVVTASRTYFETEQGTPSTPGIMTITGTKLISDLNLTFTQGPHYEMRLPGGTWGKSLILTPVDSCLNQTVEIRYNPTLASNNNLHTTYFQLQGLDILKRIELNGRSTKRITVAIPQIEAATKVSPYGFQANWKQATDAMLYYVTVLDMNGQTTEKQPFTDFATIVLLTGWTSNFTTTTTSTPPSQPVAVKFASATNRLVSCYYPLPVSQISFWLRNENMRQTNGHFFVEGYSSEHQWDTLEIIKVDRKLSTQTKTIALDVQKGYRRFRFTVDSIIDGSGVAFDDFEATYHGDAVVLRKATTAKGSSSDPLVVDSMYFSDLNPETHYCYMVQASDQDPRGRYENVTDFSDSINVVTRGITEAAAKNKAGRIMTVSYDAANTPIISIRNEDVYDSKGVAQDIFIFTVEGKLVKVIPFSEYGGEPGNIRVTGLMPGMVYIATLGTHRKGKFVKIMQ